MDQLADGLRMRPVEDADADAVIELVAAAFAEYPGCVLDLPGIDADLVAPRTSAEGWGGDWWVVEDAAGRVVASCGWAPAEHGVLESGGGAPDSDGGALELKRLYVAPSVRGEGLGAWLTRQVEQVARERGAHRVVLWSDTRFATAHRLYGRLGYARCSETRELHDPSNTTEYRFERVL